MCHCEAVNDERIVAEICAGAYAVDDVADACGAGTRCGGCRRMIERLLDSHAAAESLVA